MTHGVNEREKYEKQKRERSKQSTSIAAGGARVDKREISEMTLEKRMTNNKKK
jgi:hypothetical protein